MLGSLLLVAVAIGGGPVEDADPADLGGLRRGRGVLAALALSAVICRWPTPRSAGVPSSLLTGPPPTTVSRGAGRRSPDRGCHTGLRLRTVPAVLASRPAAEQRISALLPVRGSSETTDWPPSGGGPRRPAAA